MPASSFDAYHKWLGIPPHEQPPHYYRLLGISPFEADLDVIQRAADARMSILRSVQNGPQAPQSQALLSQVAGARNCLLNPQQKAQYDAQLLALLQRPALQRPAAPIPPAPPKADEPAAAPVAPSGVYLPRRPRGSSGSVWFLVKTVLGGVVGTALGYFLAFKIAGFDPLHVLEKQPPDDTAQVQPPTPAPKANAAVETAITPTPRPSSDVAKGNDAPAKTTVALASKPGPFSKAVESKASLSQRPTISGKRFALAFSGSESLQVPIPEDLTKPAAEFTIELWARWDPYEPDAGLLESGMLQIYSTALTPEMKATNGAMGILTVFAMGGNGAPIIPRGQWMHIAVQSNEGGIRWFAQGREYGTIGRPGFQLKSPVSLGTFHESLTRHPPFSGLLRDLRVSRGRRYAQNFTPEESFQLDDKTAVLLNFDAPHPVGSQLINRAGGMAPAGYRGARLVPLTDDGELAAELPNGTVDLLRTLAAPLEALEGELKVESLGTSLAMETAAVRGRSRLLVPYRPPAEYDIELEMTRLEGDGGAFVGLEVAGRPVIVAIDCLPGTGRRTGIMPANLGVMKSEPALPDIKPLFATGGKKRVVVKVSLGIGNCVVDVDLGPAGYLSQTRSIGELAAPPEFAIPLRHGMSLGSINAKVRFDRIVLRPVSKEFSPQILALMRPAASAPAAATVDGALPQAAAATGPRPNRQPVPEAGKLADSVEGARKIYESDLKAASKAPQKAALASRILETAKRTQGDSTARYVLFDLARRIFVQAGDVDQSLTAARLLESEYDVGPGELVDATIDSLADASLTLEEHGELAKAAADRADAALDTQQYEWADKLSAIASQSATKHRDVDFRREITQRRNQVGRIVKDWNAARPSLEKLKTEPTDAAANLAAGKFYCLTLEDFGRGLAHLAAGSDGALAEAARRDLEAQAGDAAKRVQAAGAWQQATAKITDPEDKAALRRRERWLLQQAVSGLSGLEQVKAQKRLDDLKDVGAGRQKTAVSPPRFSRRTVSMIGRLVCDGKDAGVLVTYEHGYRITSQDTARLLAAANLATPRTQPVNVALVGAIVLPADQPMQIHQGSGNGGGYLTIDTRQYGGSNSNSGYSMSTVIRAGVHSVRWNLTCLDLGGALLEMRANGAPTGGVSPLVPMAVDPSLENAARQAPTKATVHLGPGQ